MDNVVQFRKKPLKDEPFIYDLSCLTDNVVRHAGIELLAAGAMYDPSERIREQCKKSLQYMYPHLTHGFVRDGGVFIVHPNEKSEPMIFYVCDVPNEELTRDKTPIHFDFTP